MKSLNKVKQVETVERKQVMLQKVPSDLWKSVKRYAVENDLTVSDVAVTALRRFISQEASTDAH